MSLNPDLLYFYLFLCAWVFSCKNVCTPCAYLVPAEARLYLQPVVSYHTMLALGLEPLESQPVLFPRSYHTPSVDLCNTIIHVVLKVAWTALTKHWKVASWCPVLDFVNLVESIVISLRHICMYCV